MSRKPLFWNDKVIKKDGNITNLLPDLDLDVTEIRRIPFNAVTEQQLGNLYFTSILSDINYNEYELISSTFVVESATVAWHVVRKDSSSGRYQLYAFRIDSSRVIGEFILVIKKKKSSESATSLGRTVSLMSETYEMEELKDGSSTDL